MSQSRIPISTPISERFCISGKIGIKHNDVEILCVYFINIGDFHKEKGNYPKAIKYFDRGLTIAQEHDEFIINNGIFLQSIGSIFGLMKSFEEALEYIHRANQIFRNHGFHLNLARSLYELSKVHFEKDEFELATEALTESIQISTEQGYSLEKIASIKMLIKCTTASGDIAEANRLLHELVDIQHAHFTKDKKLKVQEVLTSMENEVDVLIKKNQ